MIGFHTVYVQAVTPFAPIRRLFPLSSAPDNPYTTTPLIDQAVIEVLDPCNNPFRLEATLQTDVFWDYSGTLEFTTNPFIIDPTECPVTYTCENL